MKPTIYIIININNKKIYIGSSVNIYRRKCHHFKALSCNKHENSRLQRSYNKHGKEFFLFFKLDIIEDKEFLIEREQYWIDLLKPEYNIRKTAKSNLGVKWSEETRIKMKLAHEKILLRDGYSYRKGIKRENQNKSIIQKDKLGNIIKMWVSIKQAAISTKINKHNISSNCNKKRGSAGGFIWEFSN